MTATDPRSGDIRWEQRLTLVTLSVADLAAAIAFYEGFGWQRSLKSAVGVAFFQLGPIALSLFPIESLAEEMGVEAGALPAFRGSALAYNVREQAQVDQMVARVRELGGAVLNPPARRDWGGYSAYISDLDGHAWEIAWNPGFPLGEDGSIQIPD